MSRGNVRIPSYLSIYWQILRCSLAVQRRQRPGLPGVKLAAVVLFGLLIGVKFDTTQTAVESSPTFGRLRQRCRAPSDSRLVRRGPSYPPNTVSSCRH